MAHLNLTFLIGCIGARLLLAYLAYLYPVVLGFVALVPAIGFTVIYLGGYRKTGLETGGKRIWWNHLRPVHALLYFTFALLAFWPKTRGRAWVVLVLDAVLGLAAHLYHHYG